MMGIRHPFKCQLVLVGGRHYDVCYEHSCNCSLQRTDTGGSKASISSQYSISFLVPLIIDPVNVEISLLCGLLQMLQIDGATYICPSETLVTTGWWLSGALILEVGGEESA